MRPLILIGGGGHCTSIIDAAESIGRKILGVLDIPEHYGETILSTKVIGNDDDIPKYVEIAEFIISVGFIKHVNLRTKLYNKVIKAGGKLATIIASTAYVSKYATISEGTVIMHHAFVNARAKVGKNVIINSFACIEHDSTIGDHCHISTGAIVNGDCKVGDNCFIGSLSVLANGITVGEDIIVGAGSLVRKSIHKKGVYSGNPAILKIKR